MKGRPAVAWLPTIKVLGADEPVLQVIDEANGEILYSLRINGNSYRPKVFKDSKYCIHISAGENAGRPLEPRALSARCRWELITAAALLAFATVDLAAPVATTVLASDASPWGYGVCRAAAPAALVSEALRFAELRGEHVALDGSRARRPAQDDRVAAHAQPGPSGNRGSLLEGHTTRPIHPVDGLKASSRRGL